MSKAFVEYGLTPDQSSYNHGPLGEIWRSVHLPFMPKAEYDGRRIEEFVSEAEAERFIGAHTYPGLFKMATDLVEAYHKQLLTEAAGELVAKAQQETLALLIDLRQEVAHLRQEVAALKRLESETSTRSEPAGRKR